MKKNNRCKKNCKKSRSNKKPAAAVRTKKRFAAVAHPAPPLEAQAAGVSLSAGPVVFSAAPLAATKAPMRAKEDAMITAARIHKSANSFYEMYERYHAIQKLAKCLNGLPQSAELPANLRIKDVQFSFELDGAPYVANIADVKTKGEIAPVLANAIVSLIEKMYQEIFALTTVSTSMQRAIEAAIVKPTTSASLENANDKKN